MALAIDLPFSWLRILAAVVYAVVVGFLLFKRRLLGGLLCFLVVLAWWATLRPSDDKQWGADQSRTAWADIHGSEVTIHNFRDCDYRAEFDYTCQWLTRTVDLNQIESLDLFMNYWGSPLIAHTILSFQVRGETPVAFSIETRRQVGANVFRAQGVLPPVHTHLDCGR